MKLKTNLPIEDVLYALYDYACVNIDKRLNNHDVVRIELCRIHDACQYAQKSNNYYFREVFFGVWPVRLNVDLSNLPIFDVSLFDARFGYGAFENEGGLIIKEGNSGAARYALEIFITEQRSSQGFTVAEYLEPVHTPSRPVPLMTKLASFIAAPSSSSSVGDTVTTTAGSPAGGTPTKSPSFSRRVLGASSSARQLFAWTSNSSRNLDTPSPISTNASPGGSESSARTLPTQLTSPTQPLMSPITLSSNYVVGNKLKNKG